MSSTRDYPAGIELIGDLNLRQILMRIVDAVNGLKEDVAAVTAEAAANATGLAELQSAVTELSATVDGLLYSGYQDYDEIADAPAPGAQVGRVYARDNGSGKSQIVARFDTGAVQVIATEP